MKNKILSLVLFSFTFGFINAQNVLIKESFETWPAESWSTYELGAAGGWEQELGFGHTGDHCAKHPSANEGQNKNYLVSPVVSLDNATNYQLSFYSFAYVSSGAINVMISTGSGDPNSGDFQLLQTIDPSVWWIPVSIGLNAYQGQDVYIAFYAFTNTIVNWRVDDVLVAPLTYSDAGLTEIVSPTGFNPNTGIEDVVVKVTNHGTETITDFSIQWTINDVFQTQFDGSGYSIDPNSSVDVTIGQYDFTEGMYSISALINVTDDAWADNNFATAEYSTGVETDLVLNSLTPSGSFPTAGLKDVIVNITNNGTVPISEFTAEWSVNEIAQADFIVNGLDIQPGKSDFFTIGQFDFLEGTQYIEVSIPIDFDQTPENNIKKTTFTVGGLYQDFEGEFPPLGWTTYFSMKGNFASQNNDPTNYHIYMLSADFSLGTASDTLYTPLLNITDGDSVKFMGRFPGFLPGIMSLVWKDGTTGEVHAIQDPVPFNMGWSEFNYDISTAAGINYIGWVCTTADGNSIGDYNMDDLYVSAPPFLYDNDLMVTVFQLDTLPKINSEQSISCSVLNIGLNSVSGTDYTVKLMSGPTELTSVNGLDIPVTGEVSIQFPYTFTVVGALPLHIEIDYPNDQSLITNTTPVTIVYPVPENTNYINIGQPQQLTMKQPFNFGGDEFTGTDDISQNLYYANEIGSSGEIYGMKYDYTNGMGFSGNVSLQVWIAQTNVDAGIISGKVFDENNNPIANADAVVNGTSITVQTNDTGYYVLPLLNYDEYTLIASTFGFDADT